MKLYRQHIYSTKAANQAIHNFFSCYHPHEALEEVDRLFDWATRKKYYKKSSPSDILFLTQQLHRLFLAAEYINYSSGKRFSAIVTDTTQVLQPSDYYKNDLHCTQWQSLPRHLSFEEYLNPYWAFAKLGAIPHWEEVLQELMETALSNSGIDGIYTVGEMMKWKKIMLAIVEGGWLMKVRSN